MSTCLLAVETSGEACSCALLAGEEVLELHELVPRRHAERVLDMAQTLLAAAGLTLARLDGLAFGRGPGAFTGVRIAAGVVQGMAYAADLPVVPISSLRALAQGAWRAHAWPELRCAFDARMHEVYWGAYRADPESGLMRPVLEECVTPPAEVPLPSLETPWHAAGSGWAAYAAELRARAGAPAGEAEDRLPHARDVVTLARAPLARGEGVPAAQALPVYLRDRVVRAPAGGSP